MKISILDDDGEEINELDLDMKDIAPFINLLGKCTQNNSVGDDLNFSSFRYDANQNKFEIYLFKKF